MFQNCSNYRQTKGLMTEEAILKGCLNNEAMQRELYNRYSSKMLAVCYRYAHNREDAEDMLKRRDSLRSFTDSHVRKPGSF